MPHLIRYHCPHCGIKHLGTCHEISGGARVPSTNEYGENSPGRVCLECWDAFSTRTARAGKRSRGTTHNNDANEANGAASSSRKRRRQEEPARSAVPEEADVDDQAGAALAAARCVRLICVCPSVALCQGRGFGLHNMPLIHISFVLQDPLPKSMGCMVNAFVCLAGFE